MKKFILFLLALFFLICSGVEAYDVGFIGPIARTWIGKTAAPTTASGVTAGYQVGDTWVDESANRIYVCIDTKSGAAVWYEAGGGVTTSVANNWTAAQTFLRIKEDDSGASVFIRGTGTAAGNTIFAVGTSTGNNLFKVDGAGTVTFGEYSFSSTGGSIGGNRIDYGSNTGNWISSYTDQYAIGADAYGVYVLITAGSPFSVRQLSTSGNAPFRVDSTGVQVGYYHVVAGSGVSAPAGVTSFFGISNGVSPTGVVANGAGYYVTGGQMYVMNQDGTVTSVGSFDHETGEISFTKWNVYTGRKVIWLAESNRYIESTIPKINPEEMARAAWIVEYKKANQVQVEVSEPEAFETVAVESQDVYTETIEEKFVADPGTKSVIKISAPKREYLKTYQTENRLKANAVIDNKGKVYLKEPPSQEAAEVAADKGFKFDWKSMPKFVRQAWGKD